MLTDKLQQAFRLYQQGNLPAAAQIADQLLQQNTNDATLLELSAVIALQLGNSSDAVEKFRRQITLQPDNALAHSNLCMALHMLGRDEEAFLSGQRAIKLDPGLADAWNNLGNIYKTGNHLQGALEHYEKALALNDSDPRVHVNAGSVSQLLGDLETAIERYRDALKIAPGFAPAHNNLGAALQKQGQAESAEKHLQRALNLQPGNPETLTNLALLWLEQGETEKAQSCLEQVINDSPEYVGAYINLGYLHESQHDREAARRYYEQALQLAPENPTVLCNQAYSLFELGEQKQAVEHFIRTLNSDPNSAKALAGLGKAMLRQGDIDKATEYIEQALTLSPWDVHTNIAAAELEVARQDHERAMNEWRRVIEMQPQMPDGHIGLAKLLADLNQDGEARNAYLQGEQDGAGGLRLYHAWSSMEEKNNHLEEAEQLAAKAVELDATYPGLVILRAKLARRRKDFEAALQLLQQINPEDILSKEIRANYLFELGTTQDKLGHYTAAVTAYEAANQAKNDYVGKVYDAQEDETKFARWKAFFSADNWRKLRNIPSASGMPRPCPVFIVGFPRSGTSLLEQILGSHPQIAPAGELITLSKLATGVGQSITGTQQPYPQCLLDPDAPLDGDKLDKMRDFYLEHIEGMGILGEDINWVTDKMPHNALHLGLISLLFPDSPIIHISRHPFNSCLSAFFSHFNLAHRYTSSLESTARHYKLFMDMLDHYRTVIDLNYLEIHYEELVEDQEKITRQVLEFVGAPWDDACLQYYRSTRLVKTASYEQVTRKVYRSSLYRYRNYPEAVASIEPILKSTLERFGYSSE